MKKVIRIILIVVSIVTLCFILDILCIFTINRPLFAIENDGGNVYRGIFYDTYNCAEYTVPQIKSKKNKFTCAEVKIEVGRVVNIKDTTREIKDFACAEALESFYEDEKYIYYWECIKDEYMLVEYESGYEEEISKALKYKVITIGDLDNYNINYIKEKK